MTTLRAKYPFLGQSNPESILSAENILEKTNNRCFIRKNNQTKILFIYSYGAKDHYKLKNNVEIAKILFSSKTKVEGKKILLDRNGFIALKIK
jgi:hypothetical protein